MKAIFLDRDGVINPLVYDREHGVLDSPLNPDQFMLLPGAAEGIRLLNQAKIPAIVASNQPVLAKEKTSHDLLAQINQKMEKLLDDQGCFLNGVYYCLHHPEAVDYQYKADCECRKPEPGLLLNAAKDNNLSLLESFMVGDGLTDILAGKSVGCHTILIGKDKCDLCRKAKELDAEPDHMAGNLLEAVKIILSEA